MSREPEDMDDDVLTVASTDAKVEGRLCNFTTAKWDLWQSHKDWLDEKVQKAVQSLQTPWVSLIGFASRRGNHGFNQALSEKRCNAVKDWVSRYSAKIQFGISQMAEGDTLSGGNYKNNSGYFRAVRIKVYGKKPILPPNVAKVVTYRKTEDVQMSEGTTAGGDRGEAIEQIGQNLGAMLNDGVREARFPLEKGEPDHGQEDKSVRRSRIQDTWALRPLRQPISSILPRTTRIFRNDRHSGKRAA